MMRRDHFSNCCLSETTFKHSQAERSREAQFVTRIKKRRRKKREDFTDAYIHSLTRNHTSAKIDTVYPITTVIFIRVTNDTLYTPSQCDTHNERRIILYIYIMYMHIHTLTTTLQA